LLRENWRRALSPKRKDSREKQGIKPKGKENKVFGLKEMGLLYSSVSYCIELSTRKILKDHEIREVIVSVYDKDTD